MKDWKTLIAQFYIVAVFAVIPIYYENGYFNTLVAKYHIYLSCVSVALGLGFVIWLLEKILVKPATFAPVDYVKSFNLLDAAVASFGIVAALSCLFSSYRASAFDGSNGWHMGAVTLVTLALAYFYVSRNYVHTKNIWLPFFVVVDIEFLLGFLNGLDIDPLGLHANLVEKEHFEYIATMGNVNSFAGYLSLTIPLLAMLYVGNKGVVWFRYFSAVSLVLGYTNLYMANSDGAFLGVGFGYLFFIYYCLKDVKRYRGILMNGLFFTLASVIVKIAVLWHGDDMITLLGIPKAMINYNLYLPIGLMCFLLLFWVRHLEKCESEQQEKVAKILSRIFGTGAVLAVLGTFAYNATIFNGKWGSKRGWIWMFSMKLFADGSIKDKLIGVGPDSFATPMMANYGDFIREKWGKRVANAHNEYIQYLITTGILGCISYCMLYIGSFKTYLKRENWSEEKAAVFFGIMAYAGQSVVNNPQACNYATFFVLLAMLRSMKPEEEKAPVTNSGKGKKGKKKR